MILNKVFYFENILYHTNPCVIHAVALRDAKVKIIFDDIWRQIESCNHRTFIKDLTVITTTNLKNKGYLEKSLNRLMFNKFVKLGGHIKHWELHIKIPLIYDYLNQITTKYVLFCDSHDVILTDFSKILEKFHSLECDMLFNSEPIFWPSVDSFNFANNKKPIPESILNINFEREKFKGQYLNSGCWIGKLSFVKEVFNYLVNLDLTQYKFVHNGKLQTQDQHLFRQALHRYYPNIKLDYQSIIFQTLQRKKWLYNEKKYINISNIETEIFYHSSNFS